MKQHTVKKSQINFLAWCGLGLTIPCLSLFAGCGSSSTNTPVEPSVSAIVPATPPAADTTSPRTEVDASDSDPQVPPGTLELPADFDPTQSPSESDRGPDKSGGIELPADVEIPAESSGTESSGTESSSAESRPQVKYATWDEINQIAKSTGRITVVDLWSLSCEPCLKEFPGLVELHRTMGESVQCIAVDIDYDGRKNRPPDYYQERVTAFLGSVKASGFPAYISSTPSDDVFAITKLISIPAVLVYDTKGEVVKVFVDAGDSTGFTYEKDVVPFLKSLAG